MVLPAKKTEKCILGILFVLTVLAAVVKIFVGFDIDEGYAISMPYRLLAGDHMFLDMWEVHQTSSFLPSVFLLIFEKITGVIDGAAIYLRVIATVIHACITLAVYLSLKKKCDTVWAVLLALLYFNLLPKWIISLDFSMQQVWGLTLVLLLLEKEAETGKTRYAFWMGIVLAGAVLAYPGMVLCYPALIVSLCMLYKEEKVKSKFNKAVSLTAGCALMAVLFFVYILSAMGVTEFIESIPMVFMDGTHQFTMQTKLMAYGSQWLNVAKQLLILSIPCVIITCAFYKKNKPLVFFLSFIAVTSLLMIFANVAGIQIGPFHFQVRYLMMFFFLFGWMLVRACHKKKGNDDTKGNRENADAAEKDRCLFWGPMFQMMIAFVAILIFSNVGPDSSSSYLSIGLVAGGVFLCDYTRRAGGVYHRLAWFATALFVLSLIFCKGYYVRITEYGPSNILCDRQRVEAGALKGIYVLPEDHARITSDYETIQRATEDAKQFLYLGTEGVSNLYAHCDFVSPSTISTPAFNEQWVTYFERYPDKQPDVIALAKNTVDNREKFFAQNPLGIWIAKRYDVEHMQETESLCIIKKK